MDYDDPGWRPSLRLVPTASIPFSRGGGRDLRRAPLVALRAFVLAVTVQLTLLGVLLGVTSRWKAGDTSSLAAAILAAYALMCFGCILWAKLKRPPIDGA